MTTQELMDALKRIKPDIDIKLKFKEAGAQKTMEVTALEVTTDDDSITVHGRIVMAVYGILSEEQMFITQTVAKDIESNGVVKKAIDEMFKHRRHIDNTDPL